MTRVVSFFAILALATLGACTSDSPAPEAASPTTTVEAAVAAGENTEAAAEAAAEPAEEAVAAADEHAGHDHGEGGCEACAGHGEGGCEACAGHGEGGCEACAGHGEGGCAACAGRGGDHADHAGHGDHGDDMDHVLEEGEYDPADLVAQPGAKVGDITRCPVSGEVFRVTEDATFVEYEGQMVYFCCASCIRRFQRNPEQYLGEQG